MFAIVGASLSEPHTSVTSLLHMRVYVCMFAWTDHLPNFNITFAEEEILTEAQGGFRSERRCADQILILRGVCELRRKEKKGTYMAFLDVSKAYDTVWREGLWRKMQQYGVEEKFVHVCKGLYKGTEASVVLEGRQSTWFPVKTGLHQGCPLSPLLYSIQENKKTLKV